jgi:hypothetical protein
MSKVSKTFLAALPDDALEPYMRLSTSRWSTATPYPLFPTLVGFDSASVQAVEQNLIIYSTIIEK